MIYWKSLVVFDQSCIWSDLFQLADKPIIHKCHNYDIKLARLCLVDYGIDCIIQLQVDYVSLVCLSTMMRWFLFWKEGPASFRLAPFCINRFSQKFKKKKWPGLYLLNLPDSKAKKAWAVYFRVTWHTFSLIPSFKTKKTFFTINNRIFIIITYTHPFHTF